MNLTNDVNWSLRKKKRFGSCARKGTPIIFFFNRLHQDYHRPGGEPQEIDNDKMERVAHTIYMILWQVANLKERPKVDEPLAAQLTANNR